MSEQLKSASDADIISRLYRYCSFQERCEKEVRNKLQSWGIHNAATLDGWIETIREHGMLDEKRYAIMFATGRFRIKKWGRRKISYELNAKEVGDAAIEEGIAAISDDEYKETLIQLIHQKNRAVKATDVYQRRYKISVFAINKGYEPDLVWSMLKEEIPG